MADRRRPRSILALVIVLGLAVTWLDQPRPAEAAETALPAWNGGVNLYRAGTFTTQRSWLWCTAAGVQIVRNIVRHQQDHSTSGQRRYFAWMRERNRYDLPVSAGVDPQGWAAGLRHFVDGRYRLVSSRTFESALRSAVKRLRLTNLPVALTVSHGGHGWILTGFRATADPAKTSSFRVTSVRVVGPLYGRQSKNGYDMRPNTKLTTAQLKRFFTPWKYAPKKMIWDGRYISIQPIPSTPAAATTTSKAPAAAATAKPTPMASPASIASPASLPSPTPMTASAAATASPPALVAVAAAASPRSSGAGGTAAIAPASREAVGADGVVAVIFLLASATVATGALRYRVRRRTLA